MKNIIITITEEMVVFELSAVLGNEEDFDGLISSLEDFPIACFYSTGCEV